MNDDHSQSVQISLISAQEPPKKRTYFDTNIFSAFWLSWVRDLIKAATHKPFQQDMHWDLRKQESSKEISSQLSKNFESLKQDNHRLLKALFSTNKWLFTRAFFCSLIAQLLQYTVPLLISSIIDYVSKEEKNIKVGVLLVLGVVCSRFLLILFETRASVLYTLLDIKTSSAINGVMLEKALKFSLVRSSDHSQGSLVNNFQIDSEKLYELSRSISEVVVLPLMLIIGIYFMYAAVGISFFGGVGVVLLMSLVNLLISKKYQALQTTVMDIKDTRMKLTTEIMNGIKYIKLSGWEEIFLGKLDGVRQQELKFLKRQYIIYSFLSLSTWITPIMITSSIFAIYIFTGHEINAKIAFTLISTLNIIQTPIRMLPMVMTELIDTKVSLNRIKKFLSAQEVKLDYITRVRTSNSETAIKIQKGNFFCKIEEEYRSQEEKNASIAQKDSNSPKNNLQTSNNDNKETLLNAPGEIKCPLDSSIFTATSNSIDNFPISSTITNLLQEKAMSQEKCRIHDKKLNCTVITIAHRLKTVMNSDRILVMGDGKALELAEPKTLLENEDGHFNKLWKEHLHATTGDEKDRC